MLIGLTTNDVNFVLLGVRDEYFKDEILQDAMAAPRSNQNDGNFAYLLPFASFV